MTKIQVCHKFNINNWHYQVPFSSADQNGVNPFSIFLLFVQPLMYWKRCEMQTLQNPFHVLLVWKKFRRHLEAVLSFMWFKNSLVFVGYVGWLNRQMLPIFTGKCAYKYVSLMWWDLRHLQLCISCVKSKKPNLARDFCFFFFVITIGNLKILNKFLSSYKNYRFSYHYIL